MIKLSQGNPVDFLVVGAAKSGTETLFETLSRHPGIFIPQRKECRYFSCMPVDFSGPRTISPGQATGKVLDFLNLEPLQARPDNVHVNVSGYPQNRVLHRLMTDEVVVRKVKNVVKATPLYGRAKQVYRRVMESNLKKEAMSPETRQVLKEKFRDDVALLAEYTGLPVYKFWTDFQDAL